MRGTLLRGSKVCHRAADEASNQAAKSPDALGRRSPTSLRYPVQ